MPRIRPPSPSRSPFAEVEAAARFAVSMEAARMFCPLCLAPFARPPSGREVPACGKCFGQLQALPPAERMERATAVATYASFNRAADQLHLVSIALRDLLDAAREES